MLSSKDVHHCSLIKFIAISVKELIDISTAGVIEAIFCTGASRLILVDIIRICLTSDIIGYSLHSKNGLLIMNMFFD